MIHINSTRSKMMLVRVLTAAALFVMMTQVNVWADTSSHMVLAVGYRAFLLLAPFLLILGADLAMHLSIGLCVVGVLMSFHSVNWIGMSVFAMGMAISGYLAKQVSSQTAVGSADNKVSLNVGSLISGGLVVLIVQKNFLLGAVLLLLLAGLFVSMRTSWKLKNDHNKKNNHFKFESKKRLLGWSLIGIATGIKLTGIFVVLPQYLLKNMSSLPNWFGTLVMINSLGVIFLQHHVLRVLDRMPKGYTALTAFSSMLLLAVPEFFHVQNYSMAILWIALLTAGECALSIYDKFSMEQGYLFPKEMMVGVGSFLTVSFCRHFNLPSYSSGLAGVFCLLLGLTLVLPSEEKWGWINQFRKAESV